MLTVYVHLDVVGLPVNALDDDAFLDAFWRELPDASLSGADTVVSVTLSQFALSTKRAVHRQIERTARALTAVGYPDARVELDDAVRETWRDDVSVIAHAIRWHARRVVRRA